MYAAETENTIILSKVMDFQNLPMHIKAELVKLVAHKTISF
jgi:hypothetical protein